MNWLDIKDLIFSRASGMKVEEESEVEECCPNKLKWGIGMLPHEHAESFVLHLVTGKGRDGKGSEGGVSGALYV